MLVNDFSTSLLRFHADQKSAFLLIACVLRTIWVCFTIPSPNTIKGTKYDSEAEHGVVELPVIVKPGKTQMWIQKKA